MQVIYPRCCALDVHKKTVVACLLLTQDDGSTRKQVCTFATTTAGLLALADWLERWEVEVVAMESTGIYWRPVFTLVEEGRTIILVNAQHMKAVPGRKTDVKDAEWLADLLRHGLLKASFIPPAPIRDLRDLTRYRKTLVQQRAQQVNRLQKVLETANIKLASVASNVLGRSGRDMLEAIVGGQEDAEALAALARGRLREKLPQLREALVGRVQPHHRFLIQSILQHVDFLEGAIQQVQREIEARLAPFQESMTLLTSVPVVGPLAATVILSEIGTDMERFASDKHLASWAGVCPGNKQSGGKRLAGKSTKGNTALRVILCELAQTIARSQDSYLSAYYHRQMRRLGKKRAVIAVAHKLLVIIYHVLKTKKPYQELGADYYDKLDTTRLQQHHVRRLEQLGFTVTLAPNAGVA